MTTEQYNQLKEEYQNKVTFVWSWWIDKSLSYSEAKDFCIKSIKEDAQIASTAIANLPHNN